ncbi:MAG TPA: glycosyltransferase family 9 protein [Azospirillaceae bacterium]|nr:glycosyltransferase family 9 protein [Azospirillaceae bacterium]
MLSYEEQLGTAVVATPLFRALRQALPDAEIDVAATPLSAAVLAHSPLVDRILVTPHPRNRPLAALGRLRRQAGGPYDWLLTTLSARCRSVGMLALAVPAERRGGHGVAGTLRHFDAPVAFDLAASMIENNLRVAAVLGGPAAGIEPAVHADAAAAERMRHLLAEGGVEPARPRAVLVAQTSGTQTKDWYPDRMARVVDLLAERHGARAIFVGTAEGESATEAVRRLAASPTVSLVGRTSVAELAALFAMSDVVVALDTGAMHVARAVGVPTVVIASAFEPQHPWLPLDVPSCTVIGRPSIACSPCYQSFCAHRACLADISADEVAAAADALLARFPPSAEARAARLARCIA